jgi:hypothetical protein
MSKAEKARGKATGQMSLSGHGKELRLHPKSTREPWQASKQGMHGQIIRS